MFSRIIPFLFLLFLSRNIFSEELKIAAAANVQNALIEIAEKFTKETGNKVDIIIASSGKLSAQIKNGAPYDIFISADSSYPGLLFSGGFSEKPEVYGIGRLILWSARKINVSAGFESLLKDNVEKVSIPNPDLAPYGQAAMQALNSLPYKNEILKKLVYAESVTLSNQFIRTGSVDAGFTSLSAVLDPNIKNPGNYWLVDKDLYDPIEQSACILNYGLKNHPKESQAFFRFLFSDEARKIFKKYGYANP